MSAIKLVEKHKMGTVTSRGFASEISKGGRRRLANKAPRCDLDWTVTHTNIGSADSHQPPSGKPSGKPTVEETQMIDRLALYKTLIESHDTHRFLSASGPESQSQAFRGWLRNIAVC